MLEVTIVLQIENTVIHTYTHTHIRTHTHTHTYIHTCTQCAIALLFHWSGFDPWDVSNKGLADLLEAEASNRHPVVDVDEKQRLASVSYVTHGPTANGSHGPTANGNSKEHCCLSELVAKRRAVIHLYY